MSTPVINLSVVLVIDTSYSMAGRASLEAFKATKQALATLKPDDNVSIILFNGSVEVLVPWTKVNRVSLPSSGSFIGSGESKLWDAMAVGITQLASDEISDKTPSLKHLVVLTGGEDTSSVNYDQARMSEILKHPEMTHLHAACISVGSLASANIDSMGSINLHHLYAIDASEIEDCFRVVTTEWIEERFRLKSSAFDHGETDANLAQTPKQCSTGYESKIQAKSIAFCSPDPSELPIRFFC